MRRREFVATMLIGGVHALAFAKEGSVDWAPRELFLADLPPVAVKVAH